MRQLTYPMPNTDQEDNARAVLRGSENSALAVLRLARNALTAEPYLSHTQVSYAHSTYQEALIHLLQLRAHGYMQDAEYALNSGRSTIAIALATLGQRGWWAFCADTDAATLSQLQHRKNQLDEIAAACGSIQMVDDATALQWRAALPVICMSPACQLPKMPNHHRR